MKYFCLGMLHPLRNHCFDFLELIPLIIVHISGHRPNVGAQMKFRDGRSPMADGVHYDRYQTHRATSGLVTPTTNTNKKVPNNNKTIFR